MASVPPHGHWDVITHRPIVDGKTINPETGAVQLAGPTSTYGPPTIDLIWHNMVASKETWRTIRGPSGPSIDKLFVRIAKLVDDGIIRLISVNATAYSFVVICCSDVTHEEFHAAAL